MCGLDEVDAKLRYLSPRLSQCRWVCTPLVVGRRLPNVPAERPRLLVSDPTPRVYVESVLR